MQGARLPPEDREMVAEPRGSDGRTEATETGASAELPPATHPEKKYDVRCYHPLTPTKDSPKYPQILPSIGPDREVMRILRKNSFGGLY